MPNKAGPNVTINPAVAKSADFSMTRHSRNDEWLRRYNLDDIIVSSQIYEVQRKCDYCLFLLFFKS